MKVKVGLQEFLSLKIEGEQKDSITEGDKALAKQKLISRSLQPEDNALDSFESSFLNKKIGSDNNENVIRYLVPINKNENDGTSNETEKKEMALSLSYSSSYTINLEEFGLNSNSTYKRCCYKHISFIIYCNSRTTII